MQVFMMPEIGKLFLEIWLQILKQRITFALAFGIYAWRDSSAG